MMRILIDVTHTLDHPFTTGVQRVVRQVAAGAKEWSETQFVRYDRKLDLFLPLDEAERTRLFEPKAVPQSGEASPLHPALQGPKALIRWALLPVRTLLYRMLSPKAVLRRADFSKSLYLTAEIVGERPRAAALKKMVARHKTPVVLIAHDMIPWSHPQWSLMKPRNFRTYLSLFSKAEQIVAVSDYTRDQIVVWADQTEVHLRRPIVRLYPGFDSSSPPQTRPERLSFAEPYFSCVGTIEPRKNQVRLLGVLQGLWNRGYRFSFVFAGAAAGDSAEFERRLDQLKATGCPIHWLGRATEEEIQWLYKHSLATVYPSLMEGYGLPLVESLSSGTPCITSSETSTKELAAYLGGCLAVDPRSEDALGAALSRLLEEPALRTSLSEGIHRDRLKTWKSYCLELRAVLTEVTR